ncbi:hypothetical protein ABW19_dt0200001 [Dactylella cylindrospora]|nr:hypothetical protein ABW19_dt0200001 [Dactylella cylindrospora]
MEERIHQELLDRTPEAEAELARRNSINFGILALDSNETPAYAGVVDSASLHVLPPSSRYSRGSSLGSASTNNPDEAGPSTARNMAGTGLSGSLPQPHPRYLREPRPLTLRGTSPKLPQETLRNPPTPASGTTANSQETGSSGRPETPFLLPRPTPSPNLGPGTRYLRLSPRPQSTGSGNSLSAKSPPLSKPLRGILKRGGKTPLTQPPNPGASATTKVSSPGNSGPASLPATAPAQPKTTNGSRGNSPSAGSSRRQSYVAALQARMMTQISEVEGSDNIELSDRQKTENNGQADAGSGSFVIPMPTRAPPPIPFLGMRSPAPPEVVPAPSIPDGAPVEAACADESGDKAEDSYATSSGNGGNLPA